MKWCKIKMVAILSILAVTLTVVISMALLTGFGAVEAGIDIAVVTVGINGIISALKINTKGDKENDN